MRDWLGKVWTRLPYDGRGLGSPAEAELAALRRSAQSRFWKRIPWWSRPVAIPLSRLAFLPAAAFRARRFSGALNLPFKIRHRLLADCLWSGADPLDAFIWRQCVAPEPHPLPGRATSAVLSQVGDTGERRLLSDKLAAAERLQQAGLPTPQLLSVLPPGGNVDPSSSPWCRPGALFVKPRFGCGSRGTMSVDVIAPGLYRIGQRTPTDATGLQAALTAAGDLLVQTRLTATVCMSDLAESGTAPVLRLTTARRPGEAPFLHSALLSIDVPGEHPRNFIRGQIRIPVHPLTGRMGPGLWFLNPRERYGSLPWNGARLEGRALPGFQRSVNIALQAMSVVPGLPLVNWDLILSPDGPVILEGNTVGNWILTNLAAAHGMPAVPLIPLLKSWSENEKSC